MILRLYDVIQKFNKMKNYNIIVMNIRKDLQLYCIVRFLRNFDWMEYLFFLIQLCIRDYIYKRYWYYGYQECVDVVM